MLASPHNCLTGLLSVVVEIFNRLFTPPLAIRTFQEEWTVEAHGHLVGWRCEMGCPGGWMEVWNPRIRRLYTSFAMAPHVSAGLAGLRMWV